MELCQAAETATRPISTIIPAARDSAGATIERLPFTIRRVQNEDELRRAVRIRHAAYARHLPDFARDLALPEDGDFAEGAIVLLAESKLDGSPVGTARLQANLYQPLHLEESVVLPEWLQGRRLAEVSRLGVEVGRIGHVVKTALLKACVEYCKHNAIEWALATGRAPIDRQYEQLTFVDVFEPGAYVPLRHVGNIPHRIMAFDIPTIEQRWTALDHPLLKFFCHTQHPDIDVGAQPNPSRMATNGPRGAPLRPVLHQQELALA